MKRIYLDNAASTPMDPIVISEVARVMKECYGNASSLHSDGTRAKDLLESSRSVIASCLNCQSEEIFFTSGGTESNNLALKGFALANVNKGNHIIISSIEHDCILNACQWLEGLGFRITRMEVDEEGRINSDVLEKSILPETILISVMHVNNETGIIQPLEEIGKIARNNNIAFHTDACQSFGKIPVDPEKIHADMISLNAHKIYGPKGVGALYIRKGTVIEPILHGGGQERGLRSTTENIPGIAGFAKAAELCHEQMDNEIRRLQSLRNHFIDRLHNDSEEVYFNGPEDGYPGIINFSFRGREGESIHLLLMLDEAGVAVSTGSACSSNHSNASGSHVLNAMGRNPVEARGAIRVSIGRFNTVDDMDNFCDILHNVYSKLKTVYSH